MWFGWGGETHPAGTAQPPPETALRDGGTFTTISIDAGLQELYYDGFANGTLWPLFHYFLDNFRYQDEQYAAYLAVNALFARELLPQLAAGDLIWVHDYQLIPLAAQLRAAGVLTPIGFFLHIPLPNFEVLRALPVHRELLEALLAYDLIGFQTEADRQAFLGAARAVYGKDRVSAAGVVMTPQRLVRTVCPSCRIETFLTQDQLGLLGLDASW